MSYSEGLFKGSNTFLSQITALFDLRRQEFREHTVFALSAVLLFFVPLIFDLYTFEHFDTVKFSCSLIVIGVVLWVWPQKKYGAEKSAIGLFNKKNPFLLVFVSTLLLFWFWSFVASIFSFDRINSFFGFYPRFTSGFLFYSIWVCGTMLLLTLPRRFLDFLLRILVFDAFLIALYGTVQSFGYAYYEGVTEAIFLRAPSFLGNPNFSTMFTASILPLAVYFCFKTKYVYARLFYGITVFFIVWSTVLLASRGSLVGLVTAAVCALLLLFLFARSHRKVLVTVGWVVIISATLVFLFFNFARPGLLKRTITFSDANVTNRFAVWELAAQGMLRHPVTGTGLGNFQLLFERERGKDLATERNFFDDAHNILLHIGATGGVPLLIFFCSLLFTAVGYGLKSLIRSGDVLVIALLTGVVVWVVVGSFTPVSLPNYWLLAVLLVCLIRIDIPLPLRIPINRVSIIASRSMAILFLCAGLVLIVSEHLSYAAIQNYYSGDFEKTFKYASLARRINPTGQFYSLFEAGSAIRLKKDTVIIDKAQLANLNLHPESSRTYIQQAHLAGLRFFTTGDRAYLDLAVVDLQTSLHYDQFSPISYYLLAETYFIKGDLDTAKEYLKSILALNQDYYEGWMLLAKIYQIQDKKDQMVYALTRASQISPVYTEPKQLLERIKHGDVLKGLPFRVQVHLGQI